MDSLVIQSCDYRSKRSSKALTKPELFGLSKMQLHPQSNPALWTVMGLLGEDNVFLLHGQIMVLSCLASPLADTYVEAVCHVLNGSQQKC